MPEFVISFPNRQTIKGGREGRNCVSKGAPERDRIMTIDTARLSQIVLMAHELERAEVEFRALIDAMHEDDQAKLVAIMWIGRDAFDPSEWDEALATAFQEASTPCADYLIGTPHFADHLEAGAQALDMKLDLAQGLMV